MEIINFNGQLISADQFNLGIDNRAFKFGDSIFETIRIYHGKFVFATEHFNRLVNSMQIAHFHLDSSFDYQYFLSEIDRLINMPVYLGKTLRLRFTLFRNSVNSIYLIDAKTPFSFVIEAREIGPELHNTALEYRVGVYLQNRKHIGELSQIKSNNVLLHSIAGMWATSNNYHNAILINDWGNASEATNGNIYGIKGSTIYTPMPEDGCIPGITRDFIKKSTRSFEFVQTPIGVDQLMEFEEIFISNSISGIISVSHINNIALKREKTSILIGEFNSQLSSLMGPKEH